MFSVFKMFSVLKMFGNVNKFIITAIKWTHFDIENWLIRLPLFIMIVKIQKFKFNLLLSSFLIISFVDR